MPLNVITSVMWLYNEDPHIFDDAEFPTTPINHYDPDALGGYPELMRPTALLYAFDKENFLNFLMMQTAQLSCIYNDPATFKQAVKYWSKSRIRIWQELYDTLFFRYNPIWNKDGSLKQTDAETRNFANSLTESGSVVHGHKVDKEFGHPTETLTRTGGHSETETDTRKTKETHSGKDSTETTLKHTETESFNQYQEEHKITKDDTTGKVAAFDTNVLSNRDMTTHELTETTTPTGSKMKTLGGQADTTDLTHGEQIDRETVSGTLVHDFEYGQNGEVETRTFTGDDEESETHSGTDTTSGSKSGTDTGTGSHSIDRYESGNIGTTSTQSLIQQERELIKFNLYEYILDDFKENFLVLVY